MKEGIFEKHRLGHIYRQIATPTRASLPYVAVTPLHCDCFFALQKHSLTKVQTIGVIAACDDREILQRSSGRVGRPTSRHSEPHAEAKTSSASECHGRALELSVRNLSESLSAPLSRDDARQDWDPSVPAFGSQIRRRLSVPPCTSMPHDAEIGIYRRMYLQDPGRSRRSEARLGSECSCRLTSSRAHAREGCRVTARCFAAATCPRAKAHALCPLHGESHPHRGALC